MRVIALVGQKSEQETETLECNTCKVGNRNCVDCERNLKCSKDSCELYGEPDFINVYSHQRTLSEPELFVAVVGQYRSRSTEHLNRSYSLPPKKKKKRVHW